MNRLSTETELAWERLNLYLSGLQSAAVAFSGGVDSTLLLYAAGRIPGLKLHAYTVKTAFVPEKEISRAVSLLKDFNITHSIIEIDILSEKSVSENPPDRCYHCKTLIMKTILKAAAAEGITTVLDGTHSGDTADHRPGMKALEELNITSPLLEAGFDKNSIHQLSSVFKLPEPERDSSSCLATRIPYGTVLTPELLIKACQAESILLSYGFRNVRARIHKDILRIEVKESMIAELTSFPLREKIYSELKKLGFIFIAVDMRGYRTGSLNLLTGEGK